MQSQNHQTIPGERGASAPRGTIPLAQSQFVARHPAPRGADAPRSPRRRAFTLVEMLVTFSIIAVLGSLIAAGVMSWMGSQARRNTETEIRTLHGALLQHWDAVVSDAKSEKVIPPAVLTAADSDPARARILWIKLRLMEAFPVSFSEIAGAYGAPPLNLIPAKNQRYMANYKSLLPAGYTAAAPGKTESAACLLMTLGVNRGGISHSSDMLRPFTRDTNNDKVLEFVDGWSEPLNFYRFACNSELQSGAKTLFAKKELDPIDARGLLLNWGAGAKAKDFDAQVHPRVTGTDAWYAVPVLVSAGPNFKMGMAANSVPPFSDASVATAKDAEDNLYSFKLK